MTCFHATVWQIVRKMIKSRHLFSKVQTSAKDTSKRMFQFSFHQKNPIRVRKPIGIQNSCEEQIVIVGQSRPFGIATNVYIWNGFYKHKNQFSELVNVYEGFFPRTMTAVKR